MIKSAYDKNDIAKFLSNKYNKEIILMPMVEGMESQVFSFKHDNSDFIVRINPIIEGFQKDDYAYRKFSSAKIPIPKIVEYGKFNDNHSFCISEKILGSTFQDADEETVNSLLSDLTELWLAISEVDISKTNGYGVFSSQDGNAPFNSWHDYLLSILDKKKYSWEKVQSMEIVDAELVDKIIITMRNLIKYCPEDRKLVHGDFGSNNVLVDGHTQRINAIIDWDNALYGDCFIDIGGAYFWRTWLMCIDKTAAYWEKKFSSIPNYHERTLFYQLRLGLSEIYENALDGDIETLAWCQERCRQILDNDGYRIYT